VEIGSIIFHVYEDINGLGEPSKSRSWDDVKEGALEWTLYSISQGVLDALAALALSLGLESRAPTLTWLDHSSREVLSMSRSRPLLQE
jgi:hypothetical protein